MGRKRKANAKRLPSGRINQRHESFEDGPQQVVLQARRRQLRGVRSVETDRKPVTKEQAKALRLADRGSFLGNLMAENKLTPDQVRAGEDYCARYLRYSALCGLPSLTPKISSYSDTRGGTRPERLKAAAAAKADHMRDQAILRHCSAGVRGAMKRACVADEPAALHLVKEGLDALLAGSR